MMTPQHPSTSPRARIDSTFTLILAVLAAVAALLSPVAARAQAPTGAQQLVLAGLRSVAQQGQFNAIQTDAVGNLYLLLDQKDGVRLLKTDPTATTVLAQAQLGAKGDIGLSLALDPSGNLYVAGTTTSTTLAGTAGAAFPTRADTSTNSFVAKFDPNLNNLFVTFAGSGRLAATSVAATADAVFLTGSLFAATLPVTPNAILQTPAQGSQQNGFVERFSADGSTLVYATYLTGANGDTSPAAIAADPSDNAYIAGYTSASGFPTIAALAPRITPPADGFSPSSGFLLKLTPAADGITFSTFIPGSGVTSLAFDPATQNLLLSGTIDLGRFPIASVQMPLVTTPYQSLLRLPLDGSSVLASTLLAPGAQSFAIPAPDGAAWIDGALTTPLLPLTALATTGAAFAIHVTGASVIDQTARFGGLASTGPNNASAPVNLTSLAVDPTGQPLFTGSFTPTASSSLLATQRFDLSLSNNPTPALPSAVSDAAPTPGACNGSACSSSAAFLARLNTTASAPSLAFSIGAAPDILLRNLGSVQAESLQVSATGFTLATTCPPALAAGAECSIALSGAGPGTVIASAANAASQTGTIPAIPGGTTPTAIVFSPRELDFGIETSASAPTLRTVTVTNLSQQTQTFTSAIDALTKSVTPPFTESSSDCPLGAAANTKTLAPGATCHITLAFTLNATIPEGPVQYAWTIATSGAHDVLLTGFAQSAALSPSASVIAFGTQFPSGLRTPRFLYLSNNSDTAIPHTTVALPASSPFTVTDRCPATLLAHSVCQLQLAYESPTSPTDDAVTLNLDAGLTVLVTGQTIPQPGVNGSSVNPALSVTPSTIDFANAVPVTGASATTQTVTISNVGANPFALTLSLTGDFTDTTNCAATLAGRQSCSVILTFTPTAPGIRAGLLAVTAGAGSTPAYVDLTGTATAILPANNGSLDFGSVPLTEPAVQWFKVSQPFPSLTAATTGNFRILLVEDIGFGHGSPAPSNFQAQTTASCLNCFIGIQFQPTVTGLQTGSVMLTSANLASPYLITLTGTGLPVLGLLASPNIQSFGSVPVHSTSQTILFSLANLLPNPTVITASASTTSGDFAVSQAPTGGAPCLGSLAPSATCFVQVAFAPTGTGPRTGTLTFHTTSGDVAVPLTGFGSPDPGLSLSPNALTFQNIPGLTATQQTITIGNTGTSPLSIGALTTNAAPFSGASDCATLAPGATCTATVTYTPASAPASGLLQLPVTSIIGGSPTLTTYTIPLTGAYTREDAGLQIIPSQVDFGPAATSSVGLTRTFTINNLTAAPAALTLTLPRQFAFTTPNACTTLAANGSCTVNLTYLPLTTGASTGTIFAQAIPSDGSATLNGLAYLQGYGTTPGATALTITGPLSPGTGILDFGQVVSGQSVFQTLTLTNTSATQTLTLRRITAEPPFLATNTCGATLAAGQSCTATITYSPLNQILTGATSAPSATNTGTLILESDATSSPTFIDLTGSSTPLAVNSPSNNSPIASFSFSQGALTFAPTGIGNVSPAQTLTLTNTGNVTLHLGSFQVSPDFTLTDACPAVLVAGATCTISVVFNPQTSGIHSTAFQLSSDASTSLDFVSLFGIAGTSSILLSPQSLDFGSLIVGSSATLPVQVTNTGQVPVTFTGITATGDYAPTGNCPGPGGALPPAATCIIQVTFTPTAAGTRPGTLSVATTATTLPLTIPLTGIGTQSHLQITPTSLNFGTIAIGASANLSLILANTGTAPITRLIFSITGDYTIATPCAPTTLAPGQSCSVTVAFTPTAAGSRPGTLTLASSDPASPALIPLSGTGLNPLSHLQIAPTSLSFGSLAVASSSSLSLILSNTGNAPVTGLVFTITGDYAITVPCPLTTLTPGQSCSATITFTPVASGTRTGILTVTSSDAASPATVPLTGTGIAPPASGSFALTINGASTASATVPSGTPASYTLTVTPSANFTGVVVLNCTPLSPIPFASCAILPSSLSIAGAPQTAAFTINTITTLQTTAQRTNTLARTLLCLLCPAFLFFWKLRRPTLPRSILWLILCTVTMAATGCGGGPNPNLRYVQPGAYQYQVTASSTTGIPLTQSVTATLIVTGN